MSKRNLSVINNPETKKAKSLFLIQNGLFPLSNDNNTMKNFLNDSTSNYNVPPEYYKNAKNKLPLLIFVRGILDFADFRNELNKKVGTDNFLF